MTVEQIARVLCAIQPAPTEAVQTVTVETGGFLTIHFADGSWDSWDAAGKPVIET